MKSFIITLISIALLGLLTYTNPKLDSYDQFINQKINEETSRQKNPMACIMGSLLGGFAANLLTKQTIRRDYVLFSTYSTPLGKDHIRAIGVLNNFYLTEGLELERDK
jgi:hypothetical protein